MLVRAYERVQPLRRLRTAERRVAGAAHQLHRDPVQQQRAAGSGGSVCWSVELRLPLFYLVVKDQSSLRIYHYK